MKKEITTTTQNLVIMGREINSFQEAVQIAEYFAGTDLVPKDYKNKPHNIIVAWQKGVEIGLKPLQALSTIAVINGRATIWGDGLMALVKSSPKEEWTNEELKGSGEDMVAICETKRVSQKQSIKRSFSVKDARKAGLWGNNVWNKYPKRMLQLRARALALRDAYPDVLSGLEIAEEIIDIKNQEESEFQDIPLSLEQLGLKSFEKDGYLFIQGNTYGKTNTLKNLGFTYKNGKWLKPIPKNETIDVDIETSKPKPQQKPKKRDLGAAKVLLNFLLQEGLSTQEAGKFVKEKLQVSKDDNEKILTLLEDKDSLKEKINEFLYDINADVYQ